MNGPVSHSKDAVVHRLAPLQIAWRRLQCLLHLLRHRMFRSAEAERLRLQTGENLLAWGERFLPHYFTRPASRMHVWLAQELAAAHSNRGTRLNIVGPRGSAKSTLGALAWPLRVALEGQEPYIWIVSDTFHQAGAHLENIRAELVGNASLASAYPRATGKGSVWRESALELPNGVRLEAFGSGQNIRGRRRRQHRPTLIICDDIQNDRHIDSPRARDLSRRWFHGTRRTNVVHLATALHRDALALELHRTPGWRSRLFASIENWPTRMDLWHEWERIYTDLEQADHEQAARHFYDTHREAMDEGASVLWPAEEDLYSLMCQRTASGTTAFAREKQCEPIAPEECEWPEDYFGPHIWFDEWPARLRVKTMALDPSKGADARYGDYSAIVMLGLDPQGNMYVEADLARRPLAKIVTDGVDRWQQFRPDAFGIETNQFQELFGGLFADEFRRRGLPAFQPFALENRVSKLVRLRRLGPYLAAGRVRFRNRSAGTRLLVDQLRDVPLGRHDDGPDAMEMALRLAIETTASPPSDGLGTRLPVG